MRSSAASDVYKRQDNELLDRLMLWNGARKPYGEWDLPFPLKGKSLDSKYEFLYFWNNTRDLYGKKVDLVELPGLLSLITVYSNGKININTAPYWILRSLDENITDTVAREIMAERLKKPFRSPRDLLRIEDIDMDTLYRFYDAITTKSRYFEITVTLIERVTNYTITVRGIYDKQRKKFVEKEID
jgi:general secretion pathway protein K